MRTLIRAVLVLIVLAAVGFILMAYWPGLSFRPTGSEEIKAKMALDDTIESRAIDVSTTGSTVTVSGRCRRPPPGPAPWRWRAKPTACRS